MLNKKVVDTINEESQTSPDLLPLLRQHVVSFSEFLGSDEAVDEVMSGPRVGYRRGTAKH
jgi:hypothetical protein